MPRRRARVPQGYRFADKVSADGLKVSWRAEGPHERQRIIDLTGWHGSETVRRQLARSLAIKTSSVGTWTSAGSVLAAVTFTKKFAAWCEQREIESLEDLTEAHWDAWRDFMKEFCASEATYYNAIKYTSYVLKDVTEVSKRTRWALSQRLGSLTPKVQPTYRATDFKALERTARATVLAAHARISENFALALRHGDDALSADERERARVLHAMLYGAQPSDLDAVRVLGTPSESIRAITALHAHHLFLTAEEVTAAAVLLTCLEGFNLSALERLKVADEQAGAGEVDVDVYTVHIDKKRRGPRRHFVNVYVDDGPRSSGRAYALIAEATEPARENLRALGRPTDLLLIYATRSGRQGGDKTLAPNTFRGVPQGGTRGVRYKSWWLPKGLSVDYQMLHRTYQTRIRREPTHNTAATHIASYMALDEEARAEAWQVVAGGLQQAVARAEASLVLRLTSEQDAGEDINSGKKDTATVACRDIHCHPVTGEECTDNFLMCLMCSNAVATPRHLPRLCLIHEALQDLRSALTPGAWARWEDDYVRLTAFLESRVSLTPDRRRTELAKVTELDRHYVRTLLTGDYDYAV